MSIGFFALAGERYKDRVPSVEPVPFQVGSRHLGRCRQHSHGAGTEGALPGGSIGNYSQPCRRYRWTGEYYMIVVEVPEWFTFCYRFRVAMHYVVCFSVYHHNWSIVRDLAIP